MKRPLAASLISLFLGTGAVRSLLSAFEGGISPLDGVNSVVDLLQLATVVAALGAAEGLWGMRPWTFKAFLAYAGLFISTLVIEQALVGRWSGQLIFVLLLEAAFVFGLAFGAREMVKPDTDETPPPRDSGRDQLGPGPIPERASQRSGERSRSPVSPPAPPEAHPSASRAAPA